MVLSKIINFMSISCCLYLTQRKKSDLALFPFALWFLSSPLLLLSPNNHSVCTIQSNSTDEGSEEDRQSRSKVEINNSRKTVAQQQLLSALNFNGI